MRPPSFPVCDRLRDRRCSLDGLQLARIILTCRHFVKRKVEDLLELDDIVDLGAHGNVGHALENELDHHRHLKLLHPFAGLREGSLRILRIADADRLTAEAFCDLDVIDAIFAKLRRIDVVERELHLVIHIAAALRLTDQAEIGVVHDVDVGQLELRTDRKLLDQELEVVVARQRHDLAIRVCRTHAQRGGQRTAERSGLTGVDPVVRLVDAEELAAGDLRQADDADVAGVAAERLAHLLIDALRLHRHVVVVALAQHGALAILTSRWPGLTLLELARLLPFLRDGDEQFQRRLGVGDDAEIGIEHAPDLGRLDVDVNELTALGVGLDRAGVAVGPAVANAEYEIGLQHGLVAVAVAGLQADHAGHQNVIVRDRTPPHQGRNHRHVQRFSELHQKVGSIGADNAATGDDQRLLGGIEHLECLLDLLAGRRRLVHRQRLVSVDVELDLGHLHVERQIDQHRTRTARTHDVEGLQEHARHQSWLAHRHRPFGDGLGDRLDVDSLKVFLIEARARRLPGDAEDRNRIRAGGIQSGDHVGDDGAGSAEADADIARLDAGVALSHMSGAFDVAREHVLDRAALLHRRVQRVDGRSRNAERLNDAFLLQNGNSGVYCSHTGHSGISLNISFNWHTECQKASVLVNLFQNIFAVLSFYIFFYYIS